MLKAIKELRKSCDGQRKEENSRFHGALSCWPKRPTDCSDGPIWTAGIAVGPAWKINDGRTSGTSVTVMITRQTLGLGRLSCLLDPIYEQNCICVVKKEKKRRKKKKKRRSEMNKNMEEGEEEGETRQDYFNVWPPAHYNRSEHSGNSNSRGSNDGLKLSFLVFKALKTKVNNSSMVRAS